MALTHYDIMILVCISQYYEYNHMYLFFKKKLMQEALKTYHHYHPPENHQPKRKNL